jgi:hypothetical protein
MALGAILLEIERAVPDDFSSVDDLRAFLLVAARTVEVYPIAKRTSQYDELVHQAREEFCSYIEGLSPNDLRTVEPLPYRRVLRIQERDQLWHRLDQRWGARPDRWWYPLNHESAPANIIALQRWAIREPDSQNVVQEVLMRHRIERVWELRRVNRLDQYEMDITLMDMQGPQANEVFWTSGEMDWLLYSSHEGSLAFAGEPMVAGIKIAWPKWDQHIFVNQWH